MYITIFLTIGSEAQGAKAKTVFVRAHWRVRNGLGASPARARE